MKPRMLTILFICFYQFGISQRAVIKEITDINPISKEKYVFPSVIIPNNDSSSQKINNKMRSAVLDIGGGWSKSIFENVWKTNEDDGHWVYTDFSYTVLDNTNNLLSMSISFDGGKHNFTSTYYFVFDNKTGDKINIKDLFTNEGQNVLVDTLSQRKTLAIQNEIKQLQDSLQKHQILNSNEQQMDKDEIELYQSCLDRDLLTEIEYLDFYIEKGVLFIKIEGCASGYNRNLDELGDFSFSFKMRDLLPYLSKYGRKVLVN